jgi:hypothetical protein
MMVQDEVKKLRDALLAAVKLCDSIQKLTGMPYRPPEMQPIFDGWQNISNLSVRLNYLERENEVLKQKLGD